MSRDEKQQFAAEARVTSALRACGKAAVTLPATGEVVTLEDVSPDQANFAFQITVNERIHTTTSGVGVAVIIFVNLVGTQAVLAQVKAEAE